MNYFNEETSELDGASVWRKMFPVSGLPVFNDNAIILAKINPPIEVSNEI